MLISVCAFGNSDKQVPLPNMTLKTFQDLETNEKYKVEIKNAFQLLANTESTPEELWTEIKDGFHKAASNVLGKPKRKPKKPWISAKTFELIDQKRELRPVSHQSAEALEKFTHLKKEVTNSVRVDKDNWLEDECTKLEQYDSMHQSRQFFKTAKQFDKKKAPRNINVRNKRGKLLTNKESIKGRWKEFVEELYTNSDKSPHPTIEVLPDSKEPNILLEEVQQAINKLGNNKSPGADGIPSELIKSSGEAGTEALWTLCNKIWDTGEWPEDWVSSVFVTIHKKGDLTNCDNYRTIALISHASKVLLNIILNRLQNALDHEIAEEQAGFRKGRGTRDQIFNLQLTIQKKMATNTRSILPSSITKRLLTQSVIRK